MLHPDNTKAVIAAVIVEASSVITDKVDSSSLITSSVNRNPPIGDLKMPAIPAPAPHPIIRSIMLCGNPNIRAALLPIAAPVVAIGPSEPAEPPNPRVKELAIMGAIITLDLMSYKCFLIFKSILSIP